MKICGLNLCVLLPICFLFKKKINGQLCVIYDNLLLKTHTTSCFH